MIEFNPPQIFSEIELIKSYFSKVNKELQDLVKNLSEFEN